MIIKKYTFFIFLLEKLVFCGDKVNTLSTQIMDTTNPFSYEFNDSDIDISSRLNIIMKRKFTPKKGKNKMSVELKLEKKRRCRISISCGPKFGFKFTKYSNLSSSVNEKKKEKRSDIFNDAKNKQNVKLDQLKTFDMNKNNEDQKKAGVLSDQKNSKTQPIFWKKFIAAKYNESNDQKNINDNMSKKSKTSHDSITEKTFSSLKISDSQNIYFITFPVEKNNDETFNADIPSITKPGKHQLENKNNLEISEKIAFDSKKNYTCKILIFKLESLLVMYEDYPNDLITDDFEILKKYNIKNEVNEALSRIKNNQKLSFFLPEFHTYDEKEAFGNYFIAESEEILLSVQQFKNYKQWISFFNFLLNLNEGEDNNIQYINYSSYYQIQHLLRELIIKGLHFLWDKDFIKIYEKLRESTKKIKEQCTNSYFIFSIKYGCDIKKILYEDDKIDWILLRTIFFYKKTILINTNIAGTELYYNFFFEKLVNESKTPKKYKVRYNKYFFQGFIYYSKKYFDILKNLEFIKKKIDSSNHFKKTLFNIDDLLNSGYCFKTYNEFHPSINDLGIIVDHDYRKINFDANQLLDDILKIMLVILNIEREEYINEQNIEV